MEELRTIESELEKMAERTRSRLAKGALDGTLAAGGFSSADSLVMRISRPGSYLSSLGACAQSVVARPGGSFSAYAALLDELDEHEREAMLLVQKARKRLGFLEAGAFKTCGYGSYEEFLERVLKKLPLLSTTLLATDPRISQLPGPPDTQRSPALRARRDSAAPASVVAPPSSAAQTQRKGAARETLLPVATTLKPPSSQPAPSSEAPASERPRGWKARLAAVGMIATLGASLFVARAPLSRAIAAHGGSVHAMLAAHGR